MSVGQGPLQSEIAVSTPRRSGERFLLLGSQPKPTRLMAAFDVFVLASHFEGLPVAFQGGTGPRPAGGRATSVGGLPDHIKDGVDGILVQPRSDDALRAAVRRWSGPTTSALRWHMHRSVGLPSSMQ